MANALMALSVQNPQMNALGSFAAGQQHAMDQKTQQLEHAKQNFGYLAQMASDAQGDPAAWDAGLDALAASGWPPDQLKQFRGRADLAPILARSALSAQDELTNNYNQEQLDLSRKKFAFDMAQAAQGPAPTAEMRNFDWAAGDPAKLEFMGKGPDGKPPTIVETYDPKTGQPVKGYMDGTTFVPVGGAKAAANGLTVTTNPDGTTTVQQGGATKPLTEGQSKDTVYVTRANGALPILDQFGDALMNPLERAVEGDPTGIARGMQSPEFQQAQQAGKEFLQAVLRKDTGAAITKEEEGSYGAVYLPQPGDRPEVLEQKRVSRQRAVAAIEAGLPPQAILASELALQKSSPAAAPSPAGATLPFNGDPMTPSTGPVVSTVPTGATAGQPAKPMSQADYDAIPSGGLFVDPDDGQTYRKP